jgi:non-ribosomal peptide synthetase component E (peptide arylation enzyme)
MESLKISLGNLLDEVATKHPGNEAMVDLLRRKRYSYEQFRNLTNRLAKGFLKLGLEKMKGSQIKCEVTLTLQTNRRNRLGGDAEKGL